jgi:hypothetical protein
MPSSSCASASVGFVLHTSTQSHVLLQKLCIGNSRIKRNRLAQPALASTPARSLRTNGSNTIAWIDSVYSLRAAPRSISSLKSSFPSVLRRTARALCCSLKSSCDAGKLNFASTSPCEGAPVISIYQTSVVGILMLSSEVLPQATAFHGIFLEVFRCQALEFAPQSSGQYEK